MLKEEYNSIPVYYCKNCYSLKVMSVTDSDDSSYCDDCGSTNIDKTLIGNWEKLYKEKYGFNFLNEKY